ncbi:PREDICTED: ABSCISIC ACID-INSENSITIVE 5-like protein 2 [Populus euphratica]|uniref:ABSCISIC ACID-INSENSITIVE 5-like protein 2 n=1 Tax=Populus euphratica TaxID=75702 RepID=A0AAJ6UDV6_POPEU|nr:PREDICTED: ABSCISIC ACID-INSENSITIVE 5-like protein 2 [Populus euphratica]
MNVTDPSGSVLTACKYIACGSNKEPSYKEKRHFRPSSQNSNITRRRDRALLNSRIREKVNTDMRNSLLYHENARRIKEEEEEPLSKASVWCMDNNRPLVPSNGAQGQQFRSPPGQEFLYNHTFDEVNNQIGKVRKPLNAVNVDELRNVISVEESQLLQNPPSSSSSSSSSSTFLFLGNYNLNGTSSRKTIYDMWKEIANEEHVNVFDNQIVRQQLDETTLEDFLVRAGVINKGNQNEVFSNQPIMEVDPMVVGSQQTDLLPFQMASVQQQQQQQMTLLDSNFHMFEAVSDQNHVADVGYSDNQLPMPMPVSAMSATSSDSRVAAGKQCRYTDEMMKKTIERRQKRMIKNRESAARSRAKKQAYTSQLEHAVFHSRKTNNWLKKEKELEIMFLSSDQAPMPRFQLRRTSSASF